MQPPSTVIGFREKLAYGLGDTASNFFFQTFNIFLLYYYTDVFGLSASAVGTMFLFTRIFDAVTDPLMGVVADRTQSRWGKFRPYLLWMAVPYGVCGFVMFLNPDYSPEGKLVYAYLTYSAMMLAYTAINIPYSAMLGVMSGSSEDRTSLSTYRFVCAFSAAFVIGGFVLPLKNYLGGGNDAVGFKYTMALFAVVSVALFLYTFRHTRERVPMPPEQNPSLRRDLKDLLGNGPWLILFLAAFLTLANVGLRNASIIYYFKYSVGDESQFPLFSMVGTLVFIGGALSTKLFTRRFERRSLMIVLTTVNALAMAAFYFVDPQEIVWLHVLNIIGAFAAGPTPAIVWSMYADCADYGEWKFGRRSTGLVFSAAVFAQKIGIAVGSALLGWLLDFHGFVANAVQTPRAIHGINLVFSLLPGLFALLSGLAIFFYRIDESTVKQMERELAARKAA
ncbi:MAG TPA: MFS transporter [Opitutaceae bacterium]|nr:MFS transporter [Opitutaceae bacterium]